MSRSEDRKAKRDELKDKGYRVIPERWVLSDKYKQVMKYLKRNGAIRTLGDRDE